MSIQVKRLIPIDNLLFKVLYRGDKSLFDQVQFKAISSRYKGAKCTFNRMATFNIANKCPPALNPDEFVKWAKVRI